MKLLVAIPCLNEESSVAAVIGAVPKSISGVDEIVVLVVDDGSQDTTADKAREVGATVFTHRRNLGVGASVQAGIEYATEHGFDLMVNIDGDGQFSAGDIPKLVRPILDGAADMTTASRFADPQLVPEMPAAKLRGNRIFSALISRMVGRKFYDVSCGFRCYSREALLRLNLHGRFTYTQEMFIVLSKAGLAIQEVPVEVKYFADRQSRVAGSLVNYGLRSGAIILRTFRDYHPLKFFWSLGAACFLVALISGAFLITHFILNGEFTPYKFVGFASAFFFVVGLILIVVGLITDMLDRIRANQERIIYQLKKGK